MTKLKTRPRQINSSLSLASTARKAKSKSKNLRRKTRLIFGLALTALIGVLYVASSTVLSNSLEEAEKQDTLQVVTSVLSLFTQYQEDFTAGYGDWSSWDDTYSFIANGNSQYIKSNMTAEQLALLEVDLALYVNSSGKIVYGTGFNRQTRRKTAVPAAITKQVADNNVLLRQSSPRSSLAGIVTLPEGLMLISSRPILTSSGAGPVRGSLIFGRYVDEKIIDKLDRATRLSLKIHKLDSKKLPADFAAASKTLSRQEPPLIKPLNNNFIAGYTLLNDIYDQPAAILRVNVPRTIYNQRQSSLRYLSLSILGVGLVFSAIMLPLLERVLLFYYELQEREQRYRAVVTQASEGIVLVEGDRKKFIETNLAFQNLLGYSFQELQDMTLYDVIISDRHIIDEAINNIASTSDPLTGEWQFCCKDERKIDVEFSANVIAYEEEDALCIVVRDISERKLAEAALRESEQRLSWQASHDPLTDLPNRRAFEQNLLEALSSAKNNEQKHTLCYLDLDHFKIVNDTCGHVAGDELLRQVSSLFQAGLRKTDALARLGGDEFGILLYHCPIERAVKIADKLREHIYQFTFSWNNRSFSIGVSIGLVTINADTEDLDSLLHAADAACYAAKNKGRNQVHIYQNNDRELAQRLGEMHWGSLIPRAIANNQFRLYYQKIMPVEQSSIRQEHYEVLLRFEDEIGNIVLPMAFIPSAERYNLMQQIDRWVIATLFAHLEQQYQTNWETCQVEPSALYAVNLSGASINDAQFFDFVQEKFASTSIPPKIICFEITETVAITNLAKAAEFIYQLKSLGCQFALDDFGSGMSSFAYLKTLPVDYVKIDGSFIKEIVDDKLALEMVEAISRIASVMGIETIAEFVENDEILKKVQFLGIDYAQGYAISQPRFLDIN